MDNGTRHDWTLAEIESIYGQPFPDLIFLAQQTHRQHHDPASVQLCTLLSIKTGGCPEDCAYCPQSSRYDTGIASDALLDLGSVMAAARRARASGSTRFCMGAAWREVRDGVHFERVLEMVRGVGSLGMEVCCTLGMLNGEQARQLADAGLTAYNHNLDTGPGFYDQIITTRCYADRLTTLQHVRDAGITVCCGGILGMGESLKDRLELVQTLAGMSPHPESVPINTLVAVAGTPLEEQPRVDGLEMVRLIATARIVLPTSRLRLSAGRTEMSAELQALCFVSGANSIFTGEQLLTTPNPGDSHDHQLLDRLGLRPMAAG